MTVDRKAMPRKRVVHLAEGAFSIRFSKMTTGIIRYGYHESVAVVDSTKAGQTAQEVIGFGGAIPVVATLEEAMKFNPEALLVGITPPGGRLTETVKHFILKAVSLGLDCWAGLHDFIENDTDIASEALRKGVKLWDIRRPSPNLPVGNARCRAMKSYISLAVGTDAAIGKMTVALEIDRALKRRGVKSEFVATGQCGIAIAGWGSPVDAIPGDFMAGAVESDTLSCEGADVVLVEGQGSLLHPGFSSVTLGLIHGSCPDSMILCHQLERDSIGRIAEGIPIPPLDQVAKIYLDILAPIKTSAIAAVSLNTREVSEARAREAIADAEKLLGVPANDPIRFGADNLAEAIEAHRKKIGK